LNGDTHTHTHTPSARWSCQGGTKRTQTIGRHTHTHTHTHTYTHPLPGVQRKDL
jgi:hypothetical protein